MVRHARAGRSAALGSEGFLPTLGFVLSPRTVEGGFERTNGPHARRPKRGDRAVRDAGAARTRRHSEPSSNRSDPVQNIARYLDSQNPLLLDAAHIVADKDDQLFLIIRRCQRRHPLEGTDIETSIAPASADRFNALPISKIINKFATFPPLK
jgi:hypothetical protein